MSSGFSALVVAKAPVPGLAKTRLAAGIGDVAAADIAAAALLDTLRAVTESSASVRIVAMTGELADAERQDEVRAALHGFVVIRQHGRDFGCRLARAHADAAEISGRPVVQIGMDTPQVTPRLLTRAGLMLRLGSPTAVLGPATDGGWWLLGVPDAGAAAALASIRMSQPDTCALTQTALAEDGLHVVSLPVLRDVDYAADLRPVAALCARASRFRAAVHSLDRGPRTEPNR